MNNRIIRFLVFLFLACYLPVILISVNLIPFEYRFYVLVVIAILAGIYSFVSRHSLRDLGFRFDTLKAFLLWNGALSAFLVTLMYALYMADLIREPKTPSWTWFYLLDMWRNNNGGMWQLMVSIF